MSGGRSVNAFDFGPFKWFIGVCEDRNDPEKIGRIKIRIFGFHSDNRDQIKTEDLMWAQVMMPTTSSGIGGIGTSPSGIVEGSHIVGFFMDGEAAQNPVVIGTIASKAEEKGKDGQKGFSDPKNIYPRFKKGEPDTNKLSRGIADKTVASWRKENLDKASKAGGGQFTEPVTPFAAKYPFNHVFESEPKPGSDVSESDPPGNSGHFMEFDDTPGAERVYLQHKKGTFLEWHPDGTAVDKVLGDKYAIVEKDGHLHVKGDGMLTVDGNCFIKIEGNCTLEIGGNLTHTVDGNYSLKIGGTYKVDVSGSHSDQASARKIKASKIDLN